MIPSRSVSVFFEDRIHGDECHGDECHNLIEDTHFAPEWWSCDDDDDDDVPRSTTYRSPEIDRYDMSPFARAAERTRLRRRRWRSPYDRDADAWMRRQEAAVPGAYVDPRTTGRTRTRFAPPPVVVILCDP